MTRTSSPARPDDGEASGDVVIAASHLVKIYQGFLAVSDVSFRVRRGEIFALLGPNGAGKTTIVEMLAFVKEPTRGFLYVLDSEAIYYRTGSNRGAKEKIGVLPQGFRGLDLLTVREIIEYYAGFYETHGNVDRLIEKLGLAEKRDTLYRDLSGGLKQRVGIAVAMANDPDVLFLDEPTTGLDPKARRDVWELIKAFKADGRTVFLTTHYMDEAYYLADRVCIIHKGRIVAHGAPDSLIDSFGGGNTLIIKDCSAAAIDRLTREIPGARATGNDVFVKLPEGDSMATLLAAVSIVGADGLSCREINVKKPTLEDVFLRLTGEYHSA
ncbi:MAG TPA: ABC transporter ATP-binding protein [Methanocella sp.]|jgi:ABC-2 type transport system ATP-binding protein